MHERSAPYWTARETTSPEHVMASLQYALLAPQDFVGASNFAFPFPKHINDEAYQLLVRKKKPRRISYPPEVFSLDIGKEDEDPERFNSIGFIDFSIRDHKGRVDKRIGYLDRCHSSDIYSGPYVNRPFQHGEHNGIFIQENMRDHGVGKILLSLSRSVLALSGVETLIIDEIDDILPTDKKGAFYKSANTHTFMIKQSTSYPSGRKFFYGKAAIPTESSDRFPYQFT